MAVKKARIATTKKQNYNRIDPTTGKTMTAVKVIRRTGSNGMHWCLIEDFQGKPENVKALVPIR
jgi:hypothetical protein